MITLIAFIFVICVLVIIHEAGHFLVARLLGAKVEVFSVGFGKRLWGFEKGGTDYRLSLVPLGGYVRIPGLGPDESDVVGEGSEQTDLLPRWKRALILFGGPLTNMAGAVVFIALAFMAGVETPAFREQPPIVGWVETDSPAEEAGIRAGDLITAVDGESLEVWWDLEAAVLTSGNSKMVLSVERDGKSFEIQLTPVQDSIYGYGFAGIEPRLDAVVKAAPGKPAAIAGILNGDRITEVDGQQVDQFYDLPRLINPKAGKEVSIVVVRDGRRLDLTIVPDDEGGKGMIGVGPDYPTVIKKLAPMAAFRAGALDCRRMTRETFRVIGLLVTGKLSIGSVSGPVGIAQISGDAARSGPQTLIWFLGVISLQLGIFNLLPIPILDGGHLTILAFESLIRRDLSLKVKERILEVGFYLLLVLFVVVSFNDVVKLFKDFFS